ncbi:MAG TPA: nucleotidyltransferase domain-containing protein, partial [Pseudomonas sp.]|nr:nucleotidyltransferase domain-containing protein [Pseudomonas sp.]
MQPDTRAPLDAIHDALGDDLLAVYLYGSAVDGGLRPDSDIDLLVIARTPLAGHARQHLVQRLLELSAYPARDGVRPLELTLVVLDDIRPWRYPPRRDLVFGEWLRPVLEAGEIAPPALDPDLSVLLTSARQ